MLPKSHHLEFVHVPTRSTAGHFDLDWRGIRWSDSTDRRNRADFALIEGARPRWTSRILKATQFNARQSH
jgi:hypothetical protein